MRRARWTVAAAAHTGERAREAAPWPGCRAAAARAGARSRARDTAAAPFFIARSRIWWRPRRRRSQYLGARIHGEGAWSRGAVSYEGGG